MTKDDGKDFSELSMLDLFRIEVETHAAVLSDGLLALEKDPGAREGVEALMRAAHSIKGAARIVQLDPAVKVAHAMEDCFVAVQEGKVTLGADHIDVLLRGVDVLNRISGVPEEGAEGWLAQLEGEIAPLVEAMGGILTGAPGAEEKEIMDIQGPALPDQEEAPEPEALIQEPPSVEEKPSPVEPTTRPAATKDHAVRVTAEKLNRLMALAGEAFVQLRWLQPYADGLMELKKSQDHLMLAMEGSLESLERQARHEQIKAHLADAFQRIKEGRQILAERINEFETFSRHLDNVTDRLYREVIACRMRPFSDGVQGFGRMVRDLARALGKQVHLEIIGRSTEVDRDILEKIEAPLNHLLRNAVDHGIEPTEDRVRAGKPAEGTVRMEARHSAGMLFITVSDDGRGIDLGRLRQKIVEKNRLTPEMADKLTEAELIDFLFLPGFSTSESVSEISGRGVGLDVVQSMIQEVGGAVRVESHRGKGMRCQLQLPITLSVLRAILVEISAGRYAFPLARIDRCLKIPRTDVQVLEGRQYYAFDGQNIGLVSAHEVLDLKAADTPPEEWPVIVLSDRLNRYGVVVDRFLGEHDLVVRQLDPRLGKVPDISAVSIMADGSPVLIVDSEDMVRSIDNLLSGARLSKVIRDREATDVAPPKRILVVDDSITVREVERRLLENNGYEVEVAVDGMDGWNAVRSGSYDLVVTDVDMPRINGIDLVKLIKNDPNLRSLPVMIVSYKDREEDRLRGLEAGANYYFTKSSFHDETLLNAVIDLIGEARG